MINIPSLNLIAVGGTQKCTVRGATRCSKEGCGQGSTTVMQDEVLILQVLKLVMQVLELVMHRCTACHILHSKNEQLVTMLVKTGLKNVLLSTFCMFTFVK